MEKRMLNNGTLLRNSMMAALIMVFSMVILRSACALEREGRWLKYNGAYPYLVGYDLQQLFADKVSEATVDYRLNQLQEFGVTAIRVWANNWFMGQNAHYPWARDSNGKFDLNTWDAAYWNRMRSLVQKCKDREIIVEFVIFSEYPKGGLKGIWWQGGDGRYVISWNRNFNTTGVFSANSAGDFYPQFFDLSYQESGQSLQSYQQALIDKSISELNAFGNVYFQVHNEFPAVWENGNAISQAYPWQQHWAGHIRNLGALVSVHAHEGSYMHLYGVDYFKDKREVDILNFHYYSAANGYPYSGSAGHDNINKISQMLHGLQTTGKVLQCDESHAFEDTKYTDTVTREAWASFLSGAYYFHYQDTMDIIGTPAWRTNAERIRVIRNIADSVRFWQMSPVDAGGNEYDSLITRGPSSYWQVMANPGTEYVAYFAQSPSSNAVIINLPNGAYSYKFYDTRRWNSNGISSGTVNSTGGLTLIPAPSSRSWSGGTGLVLLIKGSNRDGIK
jgi:hypothetical protein